MDEMLEKTLRNISESLSDEQKAAAKACKTPEELLAFAGKEGIELSDEVLDQVTGGCGEGDDYGTLADHFWA